MSRFEVLSFYIHMGAAVIVYQVLGLAFLVLGHRDSRYCCVLVYPRWRGLTLFPHPVAPTALISLW